MNVTTIQMPEHEAQQAFDDYRQAVKERHDDEDEAIMKGYRELARGHKLLNLNQVMQETGLDEQGRPRLGIARADWRLCWAGWNGSQMAFAPCQENVSWHTRRQRILLPSDVLSRYESDRPRNWSGRSVVPAIPPALRPAHHLRNYHILWEAEWETVPLDPFLLKKIGGDLYSILAVWDLTELERAVLAGRIES